MCVGTISEKDKRKHKSKYLELKIFFRCLVLSSQQRSVQWCGDLHLDNEPSSCLQHRRSADQYKMQYIVSMFILIRCFNHQSSAQNTFTAIPISMIFILRRSVWWPRLLGGGMVEGGYLR